MLEQLSGGDVVTHEQYLDFLRGRAFRQSLFCRTEARPSEPWRLEPLRQLYAASALVPKTPELTLSEVTEEVFVFPQGTELRVEQPFVRAALRVLSELWPRSLSVSQLIERAGTLLGGLEPQARATAEQQLLRTLLRAAAAKLVELDVSPPAMADAVGERPLASPLARLDAQAGLLVTDLWHRRHSLQDEASRHLLQLLDGTRAHDELARAMEAFFREHATTPLPKEEVARQLELVLAGMQRRALLLG